MHSSLARTFAILGWLSLAAWTFIYIPVVIREVLHEGAGDGIAIILTGLWLVGPAVLMFVLQVTNGSAGTRQRQVQGLAAVLLIAALGLLLFALFPHPSSNRDLLLPTIALTVFIPLLSKIDP